MIICIVDNQPEIDGVSHAGAYVCEVRPGLSNNIRIVLLYAYLRSHYVQIDSLKIILVTKHTLEKVNIYNDSI